MRGSQASKARICSRIAAAPGNEAARAHQVRAVTGVGAEAYIARSLGMKCDAHQPLVRRPEINAHRLAADFPVRGDEFTERPVSAST